MARYRSGQGNVQMGQIRSSDLISGAKTYSKTTLSSA